MINEQLERWREQEWQLIPPRPLLPAENLALDEVLTHRVGKGERGIWQRRFWEHTIRDDRDYAAHVDYVHFNPAKHGLVSAVRDWPYSSFHRHVALGAYPAVWAGGTVDVAKAGERS